VGRQKPSAVMLTAKLASTAAAMTAVTIVGWPAAVTIISLIAVAALMTRWVLCSRERTSRLIGVISALRPNGTLPERRRSKSSRPLVPFSAPAESRSHEAGQSQDKQAME
jgi:hypothetical protein